MRPAYRRIMRLLGSSVCVGLSCIMTRDLIYRPIVGELTYTSTTGRMLSSTIYVHKKNDILKNLELYDCHYRYSVEGQEYEGSRVYAAHDGNYTSLPWSSVGRYSKGGQVIVYYKKADPSQSALFAGFYSQNSYGFFWHAMLIVIDIGLLAFGIYLLRISLRRV